MRPGYMLEAMAQEGRAGERRKVARRLLAEVARHRRTLAAALARILVAALAQAVAPWLVSRAIDHDIAGRDGAGLARSVVALILVYTVSALAGRGQVRRVGTVGQAVLRDLRARLFGRLLALPISFFDKR